MRLLKRRGLKPSECPHGIILTLHKHADIEMWIKKLRNWAEYRKLRNLTKSLIRKAKRSHFTASVTDNNQPDQLNIDGLVITVSQEIAWKLNEFFTNISLRLNSTQKQHKWTTNPNWLITSTIKYHPMVSQVAVFRISLNKQRFIRFSKMAQKMIYQITAQFLFYPPSQKKLKSMSTVT